MKHKSIEWLIRQLEAPCRGIPSDIIEKAKELHKKEMLEFGKRVTERWGLTTVEECYIEDEYNKYYEK